ncbi:MAG: AGE family epimerase/isomerase, partial [Bacteroidales bacterium]
MKVDDIIEVLSKEMESELQQNILPFWMNRMVDIDTGGFYGRISGKDKLYPDAEKGAVLNARILWTFAAAYRLLGKKEYLEIATRAKDYLINFFYDKTYGGVFWAVDCRGNCVDSKKQIYALGFAIYGLSEYYRATTDKESLEYAITLFDTLEKYSFDSIQNGYFEAFGRDWDEISDMRLSDKDKNERKTMNTHLHVLEAY